MNNRIYTSLDLYAAFTEIAGPGDIITFHIDLNDNGQVAWKAPGTGAIYRYTPGVGTEAIGNANWAPFDIDNPGRVIHVRDQNKIVLNNMVLRQSSDVWMYEPDDLQPIIYTGHLNGETFFGWEVSLEGVATATHVADGGDSVRHQGRAGKGIAQRSVEQRPGSVHLGWQG